MQLSISNFFPYFCLPQKGFCFPRFRVEFVSLESSYRNPRQTDDIYEKYLNGRLDAVVVARTLHVLSDTHSTPNSETKQPKPHTLFETKGFRNWSRRQFSGQLTTLSFVKTNEVRHPQTLS